MDASDFGLAVIPPVLAMAVERLNPLSYGHLLASARADLVQYQLDENHDLLIETVALSSAAAIELAMLAPTFVSAVTSGFAILHAIPNPFWYVIAYVLLFLTLALGILRLLSGLTFHQIQTTRPVIRWWGRDRAIRWFIVTIVSFVIYLSNCFLLVVA